MSITGDRIREKRNEKRLTQPQLGKKVAKSTQVVSNWERGYSKPIDEDLIALSIALGVSSDYLLGRTNIPNSILTEGQRSYIEKIDLSDDQILKIPMYIKDRELTELEKIKILKTARILLEQDQQ